MNARNLLQKITPFFQMSIHDPHSRFRLILHWKSPKPKIVQTRRTPSKRFADENSSMTARTDMSTIYVR